MLRVGFRLGWANELRPAYLYGRDPRLEVTLLVTRLRRQPARAGRLLGSRPPSRPLVSTNPLKKSVGPLLPPSRPGSSSSRTKWTLKERSSSELRAVLGRSSRQAEARAGEAQSAGACPPLGGSAGLTDEVSGRRERRAASAALVTPASTLHLLTTTHSPLPLLTNSPPLPTSSRWDAAPRSATVRALPCLARATRRSAIRLSATSSRLTTSPFPSLATRLLQEQAVPEVALQPCRSGPQGATCLPCGCLIELGRRRPGC